MKHCCVVIIVTFALILSVVVLRQKARAQSGNDQAANTSGDMTRPDRTTIDKLSDTLIFVTEIPSGYRDWKLISVAHEDGNLHSFAAVLGNDVAIKAYREGTLPFPDGAIIASLHYHHVRSAENNKVFGREQSFVPGDPSNVQFMIKDSKKYVATGGWGFGHFQDGKPLTDRAKLNSCFDCHSQNTARDFVFARYAR